MSLFTLVSDTGTDWAKDKMIKLRTVSREVRKVAYITILECHFCDVTFLVATQYLYYMLLPVA